MIDALMSQDQIMQEVMGAMQEQIEGLDPFAMFCHGCASMTPIHHTEPWVAIVEKEQWQNIKQRIDIRGTELDADTPDDYYEDF